ncbi:hypothetical protein [Rosistilla oblonga]|uniref:hypothetical protein n=1 Tax=Rosistilla oblonga TaxID=2527990 RepID=UPI003A987821
MPLPQDTQRRVSHIDVLIDAFHGSVAYWRLASESEKRWATVRTPTQPLLIGETDALDVDSDCNAKVSAPDGGIVHINGDLTADLETGGFHEVVIRGNVAKNATIRASGFFHLYVGGSVFGRIESTDSSKIWVDGDFKGSLATGHPSTNVNVRGDFSGTVSPLDDGSLLYLCVDGFAACELISSISKIGYTVFHASIGLSDCEPGLHPDGPGRRATSSGNSYSRWCVLSRRNEAEP